MNLLQLSIFLVVLVASAEAGTGPSREKDDVLRNLEVAFNDMDKGCSQTHLNALQSSLESIHKISSNPDTKVEAFKEIYKSYAPQILAKCDKILLRRQLISLFATEEPGYTGGSYWIIDVIAPIANNPLPSDDTKYDPRKNENLFQMLVDSADEQIDDMEKRYWELEKMCRGFNFESIRDGILYKYTWILNLLRLGFEADEKSNVMPEARASSSSQESAAPKAQGSSYRREFPIFYFSYRFCKNFLAEPLNHEDLNIVAEVKHQFDRPSMRTCSTDALRSLEYSILNVNFIRELLVREKVDLNDFKKKVDEYLETNCFETTETYFEMIEKTTIKIGNVSDKLINWVNLLSDQLNKDREMGDKDLKNFLVLNSAHPETGLNLNDTLNPILNRDFGASLKIKEEQQANEVSVVPVSWNEFLENEDAKNIINMSSYLFIYLKTLQEQPAFDRLIASIKKRDIINLAKLYLLQIFVQNMSDNSTSLNV